MKESADASLVLILRARGAKYSGWLFRGKFVMYGAAAWGFPGGAGPIRVKCTGRGCSTGLDSGLEKY